MQNSSKFSLNMQDIKQIAIFAISLLAAWYLANITGIQDFLANSVGISPDNITVILTLTTYIAKRFIQNNNQKNLDI